MARGKLRTHPIKADEQFAAVDDAKLKLTLGSLADRYSEAIRSLIYSTYQDDRLAMLYREIRRSGIYEGGSKSRVHRKIIEFPSPYVYDFVDTVMTALFDEDWLNNPQALRHELVKPWLVVDKL